MNRLIFSTCRQNFSKIPFLRIRQNEVLKRFVRPRFNNFFFRKSHQILALSFPGSRRITTHIKNIIPDVTKLSEYNMQFIDNIDIKVNNPNTISPISVFRTHIFEVRVCFKKNDLTLYQSFYENDFTKITQRINEFISNIIKI